jgi:hypothetical protein
VYCVDHHEQSDHHERGHDQRMDEVDWVSHPVSSLKTRHSRSARKRLRKAYLSGASRG